MFKYKFNSCIVCRKLCLKLFLLALLTFEFNAISAAIPKKNYICKSVIASDTIPKHEDVHPPAPLKLLSFPFKTACDPDFNANAQGGDGNYIYTSSNMGAATIDKQTGLIHLLPAGGSTIIAVNDPTITPGGYDSKTLNVTQVFPSVTISPVSYPEACEGTSVTFTATPVNAGVSPVYQWLANNVEIPGETGVSFISSTLPSGTNITCRVTDNTDVCVAANTALSNKATVTVYPQTTPDVTISQSPTGVIESGSLITFIATPGLTPPSEIKYTYNYQWQLNGNDIPKATQPVYSSTCARNNDTYTCTVTPAGVPCLVYPSKTSDYLKVSIVDENLQVAAAIQASFNNVYAGTLIDFTSTLSGPAKPVSYEWQVNSKDTSVFTPYMNTFALKNNDEVRCVIFTDNGCTPVVVSDPVKIILYPAPPVIIPNTFTPNDDHINDLWEIKYLELYRYSHVRVFNRYGSIVFQSKGYDQPWDGRYNGKSAPSGTYYYVIDLGIHTPALSGPINVIR